MKRQFLSVIRKSFLTATLAGGMLAFGAPAALAASSSVCVNPGGTDGCFSSIQAGVDAVAAGGTVTVASGTYAEGVSITKPLTLQGAGPATTIINASGKDNGVLVQGVSASTVVAGFTVENAKLEGVLLENDANVTVRGNVVAHNDQNLVFSTTGPSCAGALPFDQFDCGEALHLLGTANSTIIRNIVENNVGGILLSDETGPTHGNTIVGNTVQNNSFDCGITLASHVINPTSPIAPSKGGIYNNSIVGNMSKGNGAAGVGLFTAAPGGSTYNNTVAHNTLIGDGLPGITMHSHSPNQNLNGNVLAYNVISADGSDPEEGAVAHTTGIVIISDVESGAAPVAMVTVAANQIANEYYGIFAAGVKKINGLPSNMIAATVTVPVYWH